MIFIQYERRAFYLHSAAPTKDPAVKSWAGTNQYSCSEMIVIYSFRLYIQTKVIYQMFHQAVFTKQ